MNERDLTITVTGLIARGSARPTTFGWRIKAKANEPEDEVGRAITEACRQLNTNLKEAAR